MTWQCYMLEPTDHVQRHLRRFTWSSRATCLDSSNGHDASFRIEDIALLPQDGLYSHSDDSYPHDDSRWPSTCSCGYSFTDDDEWQCSQFRIYQRTNTQDQYTLTYGQPDSAKPGAMWQATWWTETEEYLILRLPNGHDWAIDGPSTSGGGWTRTGVAPIITARPSIWSRTEPSGYHGWLTDGVLSDDLDGRSYAS